ncbi:MAG: c-type cytochrome [Rhizobacter sp.]|nr:c-type cytochrome [Rhizobacter sp.]
MLQANGCTACHGVSNKIVGPSFRDIARRYSSTADAAEYLSGRIRKGSDGVWGAIPMPEQSQVKDADRRALAQWLAGGANCTTQSTGRVPHPLTRMGTNPEGARHHDERKC